MAFGSDDLGNLGDPFGEMLEPPDSWKEVAAIFDGHGTFDDADWNTIPDKGGACRRYLMVNVDVVSACDLTKLFDQVNVALKQCDFEFVLFYVRRARYLPFVNHYAKQWLNTWRHLVRPKFAVRVADNFTSWIAGIDQGGIPSGYPWGPYAQQNKHRFLSGMGIEHLKIRTWLIDDLLRPLKPGVGSRWIELHTGQPPMSDTGSTSGQNISFGEDVTEDQVNQWAARVYLDANEVFNIALPGRFLANTCPASELVWGKHRNPDLRSWRARNPVHFMLNPLAYAVV